jgi:membrane associated rhomboid family serine protease
MTEHPLTILLVCANCLLSFIGFSSQNLIDELIFYPPSISKQKQLYRFITSGFIHADIPHLAFNMYSLYMFGSIIEPWFASLYGSLGKFMFLLMYFLGLIVALLPTYAQHKDNYYYKSLGASGAVSTVVFAFIFLNPLSPLGLMIIPGIDFPAIVFGVLYMGVSIYFAKKGTSQINHSAHFWGAIFGVVFLIITTPFMHSFSPLKNFIAQLMSLFASKL